MVSWKLQTKLFTVTKSRLSQVAFCYLTFLLCVSRRAKGSFCEVQPSDYQVAITVHNNLGEKKLKKINSWDNKNILSHFMDAVTVKVKTGGTFKNKYQLYPPIRTFPWECMWMTSGSSTCHSLGASWLVWWVSLGGFQCDHQACCRTLYHPSIHFPLLIWDLPLPSLLLQLIQGISRDMISSACPGSAPGAQEGGILVWYRTNSTGSFWWGGAAALCWAPPEWLHSPPYLQGRVQPPFNLVLLLTNQSSWP